MGHPLTIEPPCAVLSPMRAAGLPPIITVAEPLMMVSGGPAQTHISPTTAAGILPISTFGTPGPTTGPPTCGIGEGNAGVCMGQVCMSVILAAGGIVLEFKLVNHYYRTFYGGLTACREFRRGIALNGRSDCLITGRRLTSGWIKCHYRL